MAFKIGTSGTSLLDVDTVTVDGLADSSYSTILASKRTLDLSNYNGGTGYKPRTLVVHNGVIAVANTQDSDGNGDTTDAWGSVRLFNANSLKEYCFITNPRAPDSADVSEFGIDMIGMDNKLAVLAGEWFANSVLNPSKMIAHLYNLDSLGTDAFGPDLDSAQPDFGVSIIDNFNFTPDGNSVTGPFYEYMNGRLWGGQTPAILSKDFSDSIGTVNLYSSYGARTVKANRSLNMWITQGAGFTLELYDIDGNFLHSISQARAKYVNNFGDEFYYGPKWFDMDRGTIIHSAKRTNVPSPSSGSDAYDTDIQIRNIYGDSTGYIDLNPNADSNRAHIRNICMGDGYIFVRTKNSISRVYDYDGNLVENLGKQRGSENYMLGRDAQIVDNTVYLLDSDRVTLFDLPTNVDTYYESVVKRYQHDGT